MPEDLKMLKRNRRGNYKYTYEQVSTVVKLVDSSRYTYDEISEITGVKKSSIARLKKRYPNINLW